jgi:hypothetical protein
MSDHHYYSTTRLEPCSATNQIGLTTEYGMWKAKDAQDNMRSLCIQGWWWCNMLQAYISLVKRLNIRKLQKKRSEKDVIKSVVKIRFFRHSLTLNSLLLIKLYALYYLARLQYEFLIEAQENMLRYWILLKSKRGRHGSKILIFSSSQEEVFCFCEENQFGLEQNNHHERIRR